MNKNFMRDMIVEGMLVKLEDLGFEVTTMDEFVEFKDAYHSTDIYIGKSEDGSLEVRFCGNEFVLRMTAMCQGLEVTDEWFDLMNQVKLMIKIDNTSLTLY